MAHHKSAIKRIKTSEKARLRNKSKRSAVRTLNLKVMAAEGDAVKEVAAKLIATADHYARQGIIHKNKAARLKSRAQKKAAVAAKAGAKA